MEQSTKVHIPSLYCQVHTTRKEILDSVCLNEDCINAGPLCRRCCLEKHANHNTLTIVQLMEDIESHRFDKTLTKVADSVMQSAKESKVVILNEIGILRNNVNKSLSELELRIAGFEQ